jgi:CHAT domain-containing protein
LRAKDTSARAYKLANGDAARAIREFEKSRDLFREAGDVCEAAVAELWAAQVLTDVGKIDQARLRLNAIIAGAQNRKFNLLVPTAYYWLANSDYKQNRFSESNKNFKRALRLAEAGNNVFEVHHAAENLILNYSKLSELESALTYASKMHSAQGNYYQNPNQSLRDLGTLADLSLKLNLVSTSLSFAEEALATAQSISADDSRVNSNLLRVVRGARAKGDLAAALQAANESKQIALDRGNSKENTQITAEAYLSLADVKRQAKSCAEALGDYDQALELYRTLPELMVSAYQIHKGKLFCFQQLNQSPEFNAELKQVLDLSEGYRQTIREDESRQAFFANEQDVFDVATENAISEGDNHAAFAFVEESRARSLLDFVESDKSIKEVEQDFAAVSNPLLLSDIQARLPEEVQLVQYAVLPDKLVFWKLTKSSFEFTEKPIAAGELEKKIDDYQAAIMRKARAAELKQAAQELYALLIPANLERGKQLCLVPDKFLHQLAFASLISPDGKYLLEDYALSYAPSASVLVLATESAQRKARAKETLLSVGNPDLDYEEHPGLKNLESAEAEAKSITAEYQKPTLLLGRDATKEKFLQSFTHAEVIHFAGHFVANPRLPGNSKLLFAGSDLRSAELAGYKLPNAKLVVLSACETGFERYDKSEGAIGIARTFLALGAPLVVASQWKVDSEPTKDLMIAFHRNRKEAGLSAVESLRRAQLAVLSNEPTSAPFYWAAFSLFGGYANY